MEDIERVPGKKTSEEKTEALLRRYKQFTMADQLAAMKLVAQIDMALQSIREDPYYRIIPLHYFNGLSMEKIAELMDSHIRTIRRNKRRLLRHLAAILCAEDVIFEIYND